MLPANQRLVSVNPLASGICSTTRCVRLLQGTSATPGLMRFALVWQPLTGCCSHSWTAAHACISSQPRAAAKLQSLIGPRPAFTDAWTVPQQHRDHSTCVLASEREPPWAMTFDLRERETEWTEENKVNGLKLVVQF